jgi:hypothetical protein
MRSLMICTDRHYCTGDKIEKNEMGGACSACGGKGDVYTGFWWRNLRERDNLGDPDVDGMVILKWMFCKCTARRTP